MVLLVQAEAEERAREAANAGLTKKLREAEARCEALGETVVELRDALERQRQAADLREEMLKQVGLGEQTSSSNRDAQARLLSRSPVK